MPGYGRTELEWEELAAAGRGYLIEVAEDGRLTTYSELNATLVERTGLAGFDFSRADHRAAVGHLLWLVVQSGRPGEEPMLSALVRYERGNDAGSGFYALAQELGLLSLGASALEKERFWTAQVNELHAAHARRRGPGVG
ncbi:hypothetical protein [Kitasatospora purpeofusca]|uniref:hypothetical protein n=1 Tax=Kitasatospora purpeofusca TaxID=67352 RepID=UPI0036D2D9F2